MYIGVRIKSTQTHLSNYSIAIPARPTAPRTHVTAFACAAAAGELVGDAAAPLVPLALVLSPLLVPFGLPDMFSCETLMPVPFLQLLSMSDWDSAVLTSLTSEH
jgi:hypothetical protein